MFNENQIKVLDDNLEPKRVKTRDKANITLSYLEGFDLIDTANRIFGFGNWSYTITSLDKVSAEINANQNQVICYKAIVNVCIYNNQHSQSIHKEDVGFGTGIAKTLSDANESAAKEAVTDALKRALRTLGNQFGNSLYDKSKNNYSNQDNTLEVPSQQDYNNSSHHTVQNNQAIQNKPMNSSVQNHNNQNTNQMQNSAMNTANNQTTHTSNSSYDPYEYQSLYNIGLEVVEINGFLIVQGEEIFSKKDSIKACGFRWDGKTKQWYKQLDYSHQGVA